MSSLADLGGMPVHAPPMKCRNKKYDVVAGGIVLYFYHVKSMSPTNQVRLNYPCLDSVSLGGSYVIP